ncbi:hypothetical protein VNI00_013982 [Paramarasmius palmivorus]|uniref:Uncharacterized protein n=1 Tax=Paramarasmius palmivorus TaxID=297713 RepID=A0AAW0BVX4_9AGAR
MATTTINSPIQYSPRPHSSSSKSCDDPNCSGSCGTPRTGSSPIQVGDVVSVCMSVYTPFKTLLGIPRDSKSFYTGSSTKGARPCIVIKMPGKADHTCKIVILASFSKSEEDKVPSAFKDFLIPIPTVSRHVNGGIDHVHTSPEWESSPQYLVVISTSCHINDLQERWHSHIADGESKQKFAFYLDALALAMLRSIVRKRLEHWNTTGEGDDAQGIFRAAQANTKGTYDSCRPVQASN